MKMLEIGYIGEDGSLFTEEFKCEHEPDGKCYYKGGEVCTDFLMYACHDSPCFLKCRRCGELYRD